MKTGMQKYQSFQNKILFILMTIVSYQTKAEVFSLDTLIVPMEVISLAKMKGYVVQKNYSGIVKFTNNTQYAVFTCKSGRIESGTIFNMDYLENISLCFDTLYLFIKKSFQGDTIEKWHIHSETFTKELNFESYYLNGSKKNSSFYKGGKQIGKSEFWSENGVKLFSGIFCNGLTDTSDCNCLVIDDCLGDNYQIEYANHWYENGKPEYIFTKIDTNLYLHTHYDSNGVIIKTYRYQKEKIDSCFLVKENRMSDIYFLKPIN